MTPLHRAARQGYVQVVRKILSLNPFAANARTYPSRAPGLATPLSLLADAEPRSMDADVMEAIATELVEHMTLAAVRLQSTKGSTAFHLAASRGNVVVLRCILPQMEARFGRRELSKALNLTNGKGKSTKDVAMYNAVIRDLVVQYGAENVADPPPDWQPRLSRNHWRHRSHWQGDDSQYRCWQ